MKKITTFLFATLMAAVPAMAQTFSKDLEKKAKSGDAAAMVEVGDCYFKGSGVEKNAKKAKDWYEKAIKAGNIDAYAKVVDCYRSWDGIEKDPKKAFEWIEKGARAGNAGLRLELAKAYETGEGTPRNPGAAGREYIAAAFGGMTEAFGPAVKAALMSGNDVDAFTLADIISRQEGLTPEDKDFLNIAKGIVMLHAGYDVAANHFFGDKANDPEWKAAVMEAKMLGDGGQFDAEGWNAWASTMPDDNATANFVRGVLSVTEERWPQAVDYFSKASMGGEKDSRVALFILSLPQGTSSTLAEHEDYFNSNSPLLSVVLKKMADARRGYNMQLLEKAGILREGDIDLAGVERRVESYNKEQLISRLNPEEEKRKHIYSKYFEAMEREGDPRGTLLKYYDKYGYGLNFLIDDRNFLWDMQRAAGQGEPAAGVLAGAMVDDYVRACQHLSPSQKETAEAARKRVSGIKAAAPKQSVNSPDNFIDVAERAVMAYQSASDEAEKQKYLWCWSAWDGLVKEWLKPVPKKLNYLMMFNNEDTKKAFTEAATKYPDLLLKWAEGTNYGVEVIASDISLPELLELAAQNAEGDTKAKIKRVLSSKYGR